MINNQSTVYTFFLLNKLVEIHYLTMKYTLSIINVFKIYIKKPLDYFFIPTYYLILNTERDRTQIYLTRQKALSA